MQFFTFLPFLFILFASCNSSGGIRENTKDSTATTDNQPKTQKPNLSGCYQRVLQRDTLALRIEQEGNNVTGKLTFDNFEKDGSSGSVKGTITGDVLKLIYDFQSEGMNSVMEVYFKVVDEGLIHGVGEVNVKADTTYFTKATQINYAEANKLLKVSCESLASKYR